jgi:uncharacterized membrane protein
VVEFNNFGMNWSAAAIGHNQAVEAKHHACTTFDMSGYVDLRDVPIHTGIPVFARFNDGRTEWVADLGISGRQRVVQANPECGVLGYLEG